MTIWQGWNYLLRGVFSSDIFYPFIVHEHQEANSLTAGINFFLNEVEG